MHTNIYILTYLEYTTQKIKQPGNLVQTTFLHHKKKTKANQLVPQLPRKTSKEIVPCKKLLTPERDVTASNHFNMEMSMELIHLHFLFYA